MTSSIRQKGKVYGLATTQKNSLQAILWFRLAEFFALFASQHGQHSRHKTIVRWRVCPNLVRQLSNASAWFSQIPLFPFSFFTFLPVFTLVFYFSFVILFEHLGPVWEVVGLTLASFWSLWLIPILFPDFSGTYKKEYLKPQRFWAKALFRYLVFPIFLLTPTGAATIGRLASKWASAFEAVFVVFIIFLFFFTFQLYIVANVWSNIGPKSLKTTRSTD